MSGTPATCARSWSAPPVAARHRDRRHHRTAGADRARRDARPGRKTTRKQPDRDTAQTIKVGRNTPSVTNVGQRHRTVRYSTGRFRPPTPGGHARRRCSVPVLGGTSLVPDLPRPTSRRSPPPPGHPALTDPGGGVRRAGRRRVGTNRRQRIPCRGQRRDRGSGAPNSSWPTPGPGRGDCCAACLSAARPVSPTAAPSPLRGRSSAPGGSPPLARLFAIGYRQLIDRLHDRLRPGVDRHPAAFDSCCWPPATGQIDNRAGSVDGHDQASRLQAGGRHGQRRLYPARHRPARRAAAAGNPDRPWRGTAVRSRAGIRRTRGWLGQADRHLAPRSHAPGPHAYPFRPRQRPLPPVRPTW